VKFSTVTTLVQLCTITMYSYNNWYKLPSTAKPCYWIQQHQINSTEICCVTCCFHFHIINIKDHWSAT